MPVMLILQLQLVIYILIYAILSKVNALFREIRGQNKAPLDSSSEQNLRGLVANKRTRGGYRDVVVSPKLTRTALI